ncbi:MAG TPA: hypothetical protein VF637_05335 [Sphingomicrobium sp.]|jgi:hypothetical protein
MNDEKSSSRKYLTVVITIFIACILAVLVIATVQYWGDKREPAGVTGDAR